MHLPRSLVWTIDRHLVSRSLGLPYRPGRALLEFLSSLEPVPRGVEVRRGKAGGDRSLLVVPDGADPSPGLVWLHGGAYCFNSPRTYATFAARLARALGASILLPAYRRAPEHPYPAAFQDALAAFRAVAHDSGRPPILGGDSAGAGLALCTAVALRDAGEEGPVGLLLMSPWVDLTLSGETVRTNDGRDALLRASALRPLARAYAAGLPLADPRISPLNAELSGLAPTLVQCGSDELFLSEDTELAARMHAPGTRAELQVFPGMWHDFQVHAGMLAEAARAVERMAAWAKPLLV